MTASGFDTPAARLAFLERLRALPAGYGEVFHAGRRYGLTVTASKDGRRRWLYAEELGGSDRVSCNVYLLRNGGIALRPCEMPAEKIVGFVLELQREPAGFREPAASRSGA